MSEDKNNANILEEGNIANDAAEGKSVIVAEEGKSVIVAEEGNIVGMDGGVQPVQFVSPHKEEVEAPKSCCQSCREEITQLRWRCLILLCLMTFGQYFISDFPGSIGTGPSGTVQQRFQDHNKKYNQVMNQVLYSVYSYPNLVLAVFGGLLIDKYIGVRKSGILFVSCIFLGAVLFCIGVAAVNYPLIVISRFIYGLGGESNCVCQNTYLVRFFSCSKWITLAFGIAICVCRLGTSFTFMFSPMIATKYGVVYAGVAGIVATGISLASAIGITIVDLRAVKRGIVVERSEEEKMNFKDILYFPVEVWLLMFICVLGYCAIFPFAGIAKNFFEVKYDITGDRAGLYISLYTYTSAVTGPLIGAMIDKIGRYPIWEIVAIGGFVLIHILAMATPTPPYVITILLGFFLGFLASGMWPAIPSVVDSNVVGFCYGVITAFQNIGLATWPIITGAILDKNTPSSGSSAKKSGDTILPTMRGYRIVEGFLIATGAVAICFTIILIFIDRAHGVILMAPPTVRHSRVAERNAKLDEAKRLRKLAESIASASTS